VDREGKIVTVPDVGFSVFTQRNIPEGLEQQYSSLDPNGILANPEKSMLNQFKRQKAPPPRNIFKAESAACVTALPVAKKWASKIQDKRRLEKKENLSRESSYDGISVMDY